MTEPSIGNAVQPLLQYGIWGFVIIAVGLLLLIIAGGIGFWQWNKKKWYLIVPLKMPRDDGRTINHETAKGFWDSRKATLWVKRKGLFGQKFFVKLDNAARYLQGNEVIELAGSGVNWKPILPQSYLTYIDEKTGQEASVMNYEMDFTQDKAWALQAEREYSNTFSVSDAFNKLKDYIGWGLVIVVVIMAEVIRTIYIAG
jgi:hypothetical protein